METTILLLGLYRHYIGIMENNMETTFLVFGFKARSEKVGPFTHQPLVVFEPG